MPSLGAGAVGTGTSSRERLQETQAWCLAAIGAPVPCQLRPRGPEGLRVGRSIQPQELWERLLPDEAARSSVSREHFEVLEVPGRSASGEIGSCTTFLLRNLSVAGTWLNGAKVQQEAELRPGDIVAVGAVPSEYGTRPALLLKLEVPRFAAGQTNAPVAAAGCTEAVPRPSSDAPAAAAATAVLAAPKVLERKEKQKEEEEIDLGDPDCCLEYVSGAGRPAEGAPSAILRLAPGGPDFALRIGRAVQAPQFWEEHVPDAALRNAISREHFEVRVGGRGGTPMLRNLSSAGTLLNGNLVRDSIPLRFGDVVSVPRPREAGAGVPIVSFRLHSLAASLPPRMLPLRPPPLDTMPLPPGPEAAFPSAWPGHRALAELGTAPAPPARPSLHAEGATSAGSGERPGLHGMGTTAAVHGERPGLHELGTTPAPPARGQTRTPLPAPDGRGMEDVLRLFVGAAPPPAPMPVARVGAASAASEAAVVKISFGALPPPFQLEVRSARGLSGPSLQALSRQQRVLEASCMDPRLRVGRAHQPPELWAALLQDDGARSLVSRDHFEVAVGDDGRLWLVNLSAAGTMLNGVRALERCRLRSGDLISIGTAGPEGRMEAVVEFVLEAAADGEDDDVEEDLSWGEDEADLSVLSTMPPVPSEAMGQCRGPWPQVIRSPSAAPASGAAWGPGLLGARPPNFAAHTRGAKLPF